MCSRGLCGGDPGGYSTPPGLQPGAGGPGGAGAPPPLHHQ